MKSKKILNWIAGICIVLIIALVLMVAFSPYGHQEGYKQKLIIEKITVNVSAQQAYDYLGKSSNASEWSSYVDHIEPLNADKFKDGTEGSVRRCFKEADESGITWDEEILINEQNKKRQLSIFNMKGFPIQAEDLLTEQHYHSLAHEKCTVALSLYFEQDKSSMMDELKMYFAAYFISSIFRTNLQNIKRINEDL